MSESTVAAADDGDSTNPFWRGMAIGAGMALLASVWVGYLLGPPLRL